MISEDDFLEDKRLFKSYIARRMSKDKYAGVLSKIEKSLATSQDLYVAKAKAKIGEIREWKEGTFKKVGEGKWVKVNEKGEEIPDKPKEDHNVSLTDKQKAYLKEKIDKLKFFTIETMQKNEHINAILEFIKDKKPDLEISNSNKKQVVAEIQSVVKGVLEKKDAEINNKPDESPKTDSGSEKDQAKQDIKSKLDELLPEESSKTQYQDHVHSMILKHLDKGEIKQAQSLVDILEIDKIATDKKQEFADKMQKVYDEVEKIPELKEKVTDQTKKIVEDQVNKLVDSGQHDKAQQIIDYYMSTIEDKKNKADKTDIKTDTNSGKTSSISIDDLEDKGSVGGSTGAKLMVDKDGNKYILKAGKSNEHIENEHMVNKLYSSVGLDIPDVDLKLHGGKKKQLSKFVEGSTLNDYIKNATQEQKDSVRKELQKGFIYDAVLANWDVIGMNSDNIIVSKDGKPHRIDNGGSIIYRAQGGLKPFNGGMPTEIFSMRDKAKNPSSAGVFGSMSDDDVMKHIMKEVDSGNINKFKKSISESGMPESLRKAVESRIDTAIQWAEKTKSYKEEPKTEASHIPQFKSSMNDHMAKINYWNKDDLLKSSKIADLVKYAQAKHGVDFSSMEKHKITSILKDTWKELSKASITNSNFTLKSEHNKPKEYKPVTPALASSYAKVNLDKIDSSFQGLQFTTTAEAGKQTKDFYDKTSSFITGAVDAYTGNSYYSMNKYLRSPDTVQPSSKTLDDIAKLDAFLMKAPKYIGDTYRGINYSDKLVENLKSALANNGVYEMHGFSSSGASLDEAWKKHDSNSVLLQIKSKSGVYVDPISMHKGEKEILHNTHTKYRVVDYKPLQQGTDKYIGTNNTAKHSHHFILEEI